MKDMNRSLLLAAMACLSMGLFAKAPQFAGSKTWITGVFIFATLALSGYGFWIGLRGARKQRIAWSWLAPGINAFIFVVFLAFLYLILEALRHFN